MLDILWHAEEFPSKPRALDCVLLLVLAYAFMLDIPFVSSKSVCLMSDVYVFNCYNFVCVYAVLVGRLYRAGPAG